MKDSRLLFPFKKKLKYSYKIPSVVLISACLLYKRIR